MQLIPDTNLLIYLAKYKVLDELGDYDLLVPRRVVEELLIIGKDKDSSIEDRAGAIIALRYLKTKNPRIIKSKGNTDIIILETAKKHKVMIATMDKELASKAKKQGIKVMKLRQKRYLE